MKKASNRKSKLAFEEIHSEVYASLKAIAKTHKGSAAENQRERLLAALRKHGSITTIDARRFLDILNPHARIWELRNRFGEQIETVWVYQETEKGKPHRVGKYVLMVKAK